jgi:hypothetical protein
MEVNCQLCDAWKKGPLYPLNKARDEAHSTQDSMEKRKKSLPMEGMKL